MGDRQDSYGCFGNTEGFELAGRHSERQSNKFDKKSKDASRFVRFVAEA